MLKCSPCLQRFLPQHLLTKFAGTLANARTPWLKNFLIKRFIKNYQIDLSEALVENPESYTTFNDFFIRQLKPGARPIVAGDNTIASPADGYIAQIGRCNKNQLLQAKNFYFDLESLFGGEHELASTFLNGTFATVYLAPQNYHRVHMPFTGTLEKTIYVPGKLFSVNRLTSEYIPNLYSRNERLICLFKTNVGPMAVILVGAMIVGSIKTVWMNEPIRNPQIKTENHTNGVTLDKGAELGYFALGSTVLVLFGKDKVNWKPELNSDAVIQMGHLIGTVV